MDMSLGELQELVMDKESWRAEIHGVTKSQTRLSDWTEPTRTIYKDGGFPDSSVGKELPVMRKTLIWFLGWEDPLEKG